MVTPVTKPHRLELVRFDVREDKSVDLEATCERCEQRISVTVAPGTEGHSTMPWELVLMAATDVLRQVNEAFRQVAA